MSVARQIELLLLDPVLILMLYSYLYDHISLFDCETLKLNFLVPSVWKLLSGVKNYKNNNQHIEKTKRLKFRDLNCDLDAM